MYSDRRRWFLADPANSQCPVAKAGLIPFAFAGETVPHYRASTTIHHAWRRGRYTLDITTWLGCSLEGHIWIEANLAESRKRGWLCDTAETRERWRAAHGGFPLV